jgi:glycosyltransferase involved in cell wall biosynthesis
MEKSTHSIIKPIAFIGNYLPRHCGIATFTTDLCESISDEYKGTACIALPVNDVVVMSERGAEFLQTVYDVPEEKIGLIPHGIPDMPFMDPSFHKDLFGVEGKNVLLSFGLLSANKGIENVISALPMILEKFPNVVYMIVGATHPHVVEHEGESYRLSLQWLAREKGVEANVSFYNRFVSLEELIQFISASDIYITPYLDVAQITSGTLAYTLGAGKAVVSTPYWYPEEMLAEDRGALVPFSDPQALAEQVIDLLGNEVLFETR